MSPADGSLNLIDLKAVQYPNAAFPTSLKQPGNSIDCNLLQYAKVLYSRFLKVFGNLTSVRPLQPKQASLCITVILLLEKSSVEIPS